MGKFAVTDNLIESVSRAFGVSMDNVKSLQSLYYKDIRPRLETQYLAHVARAARRSGKREAWA